MTSNVLLRFNTPLSPGPARSSTLLFAFPRHGLTCLDLVQNAQILGQVFGDWGPTWRGRPHFGRSLTPWPLDRTILSVALGPPPSLIFPPRWSQWFLQPALFPPGQVGARRLPRAGTDLRLLTFRQFLILRVIPASGLSVPILSAGFILRAS